MSLFAVDILECIHVMGKKTQNDKERKKMEILLRLMIYFLFISGMLCLKSLNTAKGIGIFFICIAMALDYRNIKNRRK